MKNRREIALKAAAGLAEWTDRIDEALKARDDEWSAELTRLRTANAALRAECVACREVDRLCEVCPEETADIVAAETRVTDARQLTDSTPGAMEGA